MFRLNTLALLGAAVFSAAASENQTVHYRQADVRGVKVFYREAGPRTAPAVLLLHGFPSSSHMFRALIPKLAENYRVIAPDYPGFGQSDMPSPRDYSYTFAQLADTMDAFAQQVGLQKYALYVMDYGAPVGYRLALKHPERVTALIVQNGNAYEEGLRDFWAPIRKLWADPSAANRDALRPFLKLDGTRWQYTHGVKDPTRLSPDAWLVDQAGLDRPGNDEIQLALFYDYRTNLELYPKIQEYFRTRRPATLIVWGKNDTIFPPEGATPYRRDLPQAELHLIDAGHFALESNGEEIADYILDFLGRKLAKR